jgi:two-component system, NarL family, sensor histidine kinase DesK
VADHPTATQTDAPAAGTSVAGVFGAPDGREGSWIPAWRVAGAAFIAYPIVRVIGQPPEPLVAALVLAATACFTFLLWAVARRDPIDPRRASPWLAALDVAILGLGAAAEVRAPGQGWFALFYYASTAASTLLPERRALALIVTAGIVAALTLTLSVDLASALIQGLSVSIIGVTVFAMTALRRTNVKLHVARQELATLAVAEERNRIARDLHDVLGHSLSLIAIKSELAGRLLPGEPDRARAEIADVEQVAREALASVRETVGGYRQPSLDRELASAKVVLDASGIDATIEHGVGPLPSSQDVVLAWAVREAVTNVVRHSAASHATIRTSRHGTQAELEVVDDGAPEPASADAARSGVQASDGTGLQGLRERLEGAGGRLDAGPGVGGGYRVIATVPIAAGNGESA